MTLFFGGKGRLHGIRAEIRVKRRVAPTSFRTTPSPLVRFSPQHAGSGRLLYKRGRWIRHIGDPAAFWLPTYSFGFQIPDLQNPLEMVIGISSRGSDHATYNRVCILDSYESRRESGSVCLVFQRCARGPLFSLGSWHLNGKTDQLASWPSAISTTSLPTFASLLF